MDHPIYICILKVQKYGILHICFVPLLYIFEQQSVTLKEGCEVELRENEVPKKIFETEKLQLCGEIKDIR
jgi:hypothetical protein